MMSRKTQTRLTRGLLLVVYVLATSTAALFHDHAGPCGGGATCPEHATACVDHDHAAGSCHEDGAAASDAPLPCHDPLADDDCAVCRFLGLCSLPVAPPAVLAQGDLLIRANPAEPIDAARPFDRAIHSRGPPRLG
jgi:hypothetical protein